MTEFVLAGRSLSVSDRTEATGRSQDDSSTSHVRALAESEIKKALRADALQQPTTILPLALVFVSLIWLLFLSPVVGGGMVPLVLLMVGVVLAGGSYFWRYSIRFDQEYARRTQEIMDTIEQYSSAAGEVDLKEPQDTLLSGFASLNSSEGPEALSQLVEVYDRLQPVLESKRVTDPMAVAQIPGLAEETFKQGLSVPADALGLMTAIHSPQNDRLERQIAEYEKELEVLRRDPS